MLSFCALILIDICIPREFVPVTTFGALYSSQEMEARNARGLTGQATSGLVIDMFRSDAPEVVVQSSPEISRVCNAQTCIYYRRHCASDHNCEYAFATLTRAASDTGQNPVFSQFLKLAAPNAAAFDNLSRGLTFKISQDETSGQAEAPAIAIHDLERESPDAKVSLPRPKRLDH